MSRRALASRSRVRPHRRSVLGRHRPARKLRSVVVLPPTVVVQISSIGPELRIGSPTATGGGFVTQVSSIPPSVGFGTPSVRQVVSMPNIPSGVQFGFPRARLGEPPDVVVRVGGIASGTVFGRPRVDGGEDWREETAARIRTMFYDMNTGVPVAWDNRPMCVNPTPKLWVRFSVQQGAEVQVTTGGGAHYRHAGIATAQIFGRLSKGDQALIRLADDICDEFRGRHREGLFFDAPSVQNLGREGMWWSMNVSLPFVAERYFEATA